jgi:hypothetical protein
MRALSGLGPPPEKAAAPTEGFGQGRRGPTGHSEIDETEPPDKPTGIDPFVAWVWPLLSATAKAQARRVRLAPHDPLRELLALVVRCSDGIVFADRVSRRSRECRR